MDIKFIDNNFVFTWPGKEECIKTLDNKIEMHVVREVDHPRENKLIGGKTLSTLKFLQLEGYENKIKLIVFNAIYDNKNFYSNFLNIHEKDKLEYFKYLSDMYECIHAARKLLKDDGVMIIEVNVKSSPYLGIICDEIFGMENFLINIGRLIYSHKDMFDLLYTKNHESILKYKYLHGKVGEDYYDRYNRGNLIVHTTNEQDIILAVNSCPTIHACIATNETYHSDRKWIGIVPNKLLSENSEFDRNDRTEETVLEFAKSRIMLFINTIIQKIDKDKIDHSNYNECVTSHQYPKNFETIDIS